MPMLRKQNAHHSILLVFVLILGTVAPVMVEAVDTVSITNSVRSSNNTGGVSSADGADGQPGRDGSSGESVSSVSGSGEASVHVQTTAGGKVITNITKSTTGTDSVAEVDTEVNTNSTSHLGSDDAPSSVNENPSEETKLNQIITTLQTLISHYVSVFF